MPAAALPPNEAERLAELHSFDLLDTPEEEAFDEIARIASVIFDMPIALVSLVDEARQYFKARVGLDAQETSRDVAFCSHAILDSKVMVIEDAQADDRFRDNALVQKQPHIRFYAGAPLVTDAGNRLGTLCLIDTKPRKLNQEEAGLLQMLANRVISEMKLRRAHAQLLKHRDNINRLFGTLSDGVIAINAAGEIAFVDEKAAGVFHIAQENALGSRWENALGLDEKSSAILRNLLTGDTSGPVPLQLDEYDTALEVRKAAIPESPGEVALILSDVTEVSQMRALLTGSHIHYGIVGKAPVMRNIGIQVAQVAELDVPILISGATGTGKDLIANAIHKMSARKEGPFVAVNCGALTASLLTSQLFGHKRGAFTGAVSDQTGLFEDGRGGTVFLDEIGDMPIDLQVSLLRVLDSKQVSRLGESSQRSVDFRLISATNRDLQQLIAEGRFREDLYYRIRGLDIRMPPLTERREDIPLLLEHFAQIDALASGAKPAHFSKNALAALMRYSWPGNVRQLRSVVSFALLHCSRGIIRLSDLPPEIAADVMAQPDPMRVLEQPASGRRGTADSKDELLAALEAARGNRSKAAKLLGISRATLYRRLEQHGLTGK